MNNFISIHTHTEYSLQDSMSNYKDFIDLCVSNNMRAIAFTEHGNVYGWIKKKQYCDKVGIKYIHGCEIYLTEKLEDKVRDNFHTIILAKNWEGVKEINKLMELTHREDHFFYKPRLSFDEFLNLSDNIVTTSACLGSPLYKLSHTNPYYYKLVEKYDYLEVQPHVKSEDQKEFNKTILKLSKQHNKPIVAGGDFHEINKYKQKCRSVMKKSKGMSYENEDEYDLRFKPYNEFYQDFKDQGILSEDEILESLKNTIKISQEVEDFELDYEFKYPQLYDNPTKYFISEIKKRLAEKIKLKVLEDNEELKDRLNYEYSVYKKMKAEGFMLSMMEITDFAEENDIPIGRARGSVSGSLISYILGVTDINPLKYGLYFSRFLNEHRISLSDIDTDISKKERYKIVNFMYERYGYKGATNIITFGTMQDNACIENICRGLEISIPDMEKIKKEYSEFPEESREKHKDVFYYFDGFKGVIIQKGIHAAGVCASTLDLREEIGIFWDQKAKCNVSMCDMKEIDSLNFVKYDLLGLKTLDVIKDTYKLMGEKTKKTHDIDWNDKRVFDEIQKHQLGLFQFESNFAYSLLKEFKPESIEDIAIVSGVIRPSADSFREKLINKEFNKNPSAQIDELLGETYGYLLYQEDIISFLNKICGLTPSEADLVRRFIGKKQADKLTEYLPRIEKGFVDNGGTSEEFKQFMKVLDDASGYSFSKNHSIPYSELTYETAKLRMENNIYFVTAYLNNASNDDDIAMATQYMKDNKLILMPITFGKSIDKYGTDGTCIYKGLESIKFLNKIIPFELNDMNNIDNFVDLLEKITFDSSVNTKQLDILIKLDYFLEFGKMGKLLKFNELYHKMLLSDKKGYKKNMSIDDVDPDIYPYIRNCTKTPKRYVIETPSKILLNIWKSIPDKDEEIINKIKYELKFLGYIKTEIPKGIKIGKVLYNKKNKTGTCLKSLRNGNEEWFDLDKDVKLPNKEDVLHIIDMFKTESKSKYRKGNYVLKAYDILKEG